MDEIKFDYTREELIAICEQAVVPMAKWANRDSPSSHEKLGLAWVMLKAGADFYVHPPVPGKVVRGLHTDRETIWVTIYWRNFNDFEYGTRAASESDTFYLPTPDRLKEREGRDWY